MIEAEHTSETSVYFNDSRRYVPDGCHLHTRRRENQKFLSVYLRKTKSVLLKEEQKLKVFKNKVLLIINIWAQKRRK
jgi:hypothetical protein